MGNVSKAVGTEGQTAGKIQKAKSKKQNTKGKMQKARKQKRKTLKGLNVNNYGCNP